MIKVTVLDIDKEESDVSKGEFGVVLTGTNEAKGVKFESMVFGDFSIKSIFTTLEALEDLKVNIADKFIEGLPMSEMPAFTRGLAQYIIRSENKTDKYKQPYKSDLKNKL